ncbi:DUF6460 domain-containing protein [Pelagibacterium sediminicola]|uniref:DUF6460 domain-containing protein n=1 Tax=Pelagibacterium sediminicola TaxID=2248761 RepID=UPI001FE513DE|nr:DUF6460 domain-containing protein [Pelagibacterium sediminicola]
MASYIQNHDQKAEPAMPETIERNEPRERPSPLVAILGDTPGRVAVRLILMSLLMGFLMAMFGISPQDIFRSIERLFSGIFENGFGVLRDAWGYALTGAMVVIPIWIILRLASAGRKR